MDFCSEVIDKLHVKMKHLFDLFLNFVKFYWIIELKTVSQYNKLSNTADIFTLTLPNINLPFFVFVVSSLSGSDCVLFYEINKYN